MKQGTGSSRMGATKTEPKPHAVSLDKVAGLGVHQVRTTSKELYTGKGYSAPMASSSSHKSGSQGKH